MDDPTRTRPIIPAIILILVGVWFLLQNLNVPGVRLEAFWPIFLVIGGIALIIRYFTTPTADPDDLGGAIFMTLLGVFFLGWYNLNWFGQEWEVAWPCLLYTSDAADERSSVDLGGRRIIKKKTK